MRFSQFARRALPSLLAIFAVAIVAVGVLPARDSDAADPPSPRVFLPVIPNEQGTGIGIFGFEITGVVNSGDEAKAIAHGQALTPGFVRVNTIDWAKIEATRGQYDWTVTDAEMQRAAQIGAHVIAVVQGTPAWARTPEFPSVNGPFPDEYLGDFERFWEAVVRRYSQAPYHVKYWEVYNEPDNVGEQFAGVIASFGNRPDKYAEVLKRAYGVVKRVDPSATVIFGSLAHDYFNDTLDSGIIRIEPGVFRRDFLPLVLDHLGPNAGNYFDAIGFHYYPDYDARWLSKKPEHAPNPVAAKAAVMREYLAARGINDKPVFNTEIGDRSAPTCEVDATEDSQARFLVRLFGRSLGAGLQSVIWYRLSDDANPNPDADCFAFNGLVHPNADPKLSYTAFSVAMEYLGDATFLKTLTAADTGNGNVEGYLVRTVEGQEVRLMWANSAESQTISIPGASSVTVMTKDGTSTTLPGNEVTLTSDPVYVFSN